MPNFPISAPVTLKRSGAASFKDAAGKTFTLQLNDLPIAATNAKISDLIEASANISNAGLSKTLIGDTSTIPEADILALDDAESSVTARAVFTFENAALKQRAYSIPAPDMSIFDASGESVLAPGLNALVLAFVTAVTDVLNAGGDTYAYIGGVRDDVPYAEDTPLWEAVGLAQDDATKALEDSASALTIANLANTTAAAALAEASRKWQDQFAFYGDEMRYNAGTPLSSVQSTFPYNWITFTSTNLANPIMTLNLRPGTWTFKILTFKRNDAANLTLNLNGFTILNKLNLYSLAANLAYVHTLTGITVGVHAQNELWFLADGHTNPSSSYVMVIMKVWGWRTGA